LQDKPREIGLGVMDIHFHGNSVPLIS
jgi:hypothetical protein